MKTRKKVIEILKHLLWMNKSDYFFPFQNVLMTPGMPESQVDESDYITGKRTLRSLSNQTWEHFFMSANDFH